MKMRGRFVPLILFLLANVPAFAGSFDNPVLAPDRADPTLIYNPRSRSFWCLATSGGGKGTWYSSSDLVKWHDTGKHPYSDSTYVKIKEYGQKIWAPQVFYNGSRYILYLTLYNSREDCRIVALGSPSLDEEFEFAGVVADSRTNGIPDTIDPFVIRDIRSGRVWMFFGSTGGMYIQEMNSEATAMLAGSSPRHIAGLDIKHDGSRLTVFEGSYVYYRDGYYYLIASRGNYWDHSYGLVMGRSRNIDGPYTDKDGIDMRNGGGSVLLASGQGDRLFGPGHNGELCTDKKGRIFMPYHCHDAASQNPSRRPMCIQELFWSADGWPYFQDSRPQVSGQAPVL